MRFGIALRLWSKMGFDPIDDGANGLVLIDKIIEPQGCYFSALRDLVLHIGDPFAVPLSFVERADIVQRHRRMPWNVKDALRQSAGAARAINEEN